MKHEKIHDTPSDVKAAPGEVLVSGPDGVAVSMTPEAAAKTGARLIDNAAEAKGQQDIARRPQRDSA